MKRFSKLITVTLVLLALSACKKSDYIITPIDNGEVAFKITNFSDKVGKTQTLTPHKVIYEFQDQAEELWEGELLPVPFGEDSFVSSSMELQVGEFSLTKFLVTDIDGAVIYATPVDGSEFSHLINYPLPIEFFITPNEETILSLEVVSVVDSTPEDFGYLSFNFNPIEAIELSIKTTIVSIEPLTNPVNYELTVSAMDKEGVVQWEHTFNRASGDASIVIPLGYMNYCIKASSENFRDHFQCYQEEILVESGNLSFELLPSDDEDLNAVGVEFVESDNIIFFYASNPCVLYSRIDFKEKFDGMFYSMVDIGTYDKNGIPIGLPNISEQFNSTKLYVNLWSGTPLAEAGNHCEARFGSDDPSILEENGVAIIESIAVMDTGTEFLFANKVCEVSGFCEIEIVDF